MCHKSVIGFGIKNLTIEEIKGKKIIDIGSRDINGSYKPLIMPMKPSEYIGVDICNGKYVDIICNVKNIVEKFGKESFDVVISTELLEHVENWRKAISNIKQICKKNGIIIITARSYGKKVHGYPSDYWRYETDDIANIFSDCKVLKLEKDLQEPGFFLKVIKPDSFVEKDLSKYELYNIVHDKKMI